MHAFKLFWVLATRQPRVFVRFGGQSLKLDCKYGRLASAQPCMGCQSVDKRSHDLKGLNMNKVFIKENRLLALKDEEVLQEFEMVELKGGSSISPLGDNYGCNTSVCGCNVKDCKDESDVSDKCYEPVEPNSMYICWPK